MSVTAVPASGAGTVRRDRALGRCLGSAAPIVLLAAPAGYGKTTVLSQWVGADPRRTGWIAADWRHDDPAYLLSRLAERLDAIEPLDDDVLAPLAAPPPNLDLVAIRLAASLGEIDEPFLLVIDDLHAVTDRSALRALAAILDSVPEGSTIALASRGEPPLPFGRWRARGALAELRSADLAMTPDEAAELVEGAGLSLEREQLALIVERTEGWPAGLYLATMALSRTADLDEGLARFCGDERLIADYLRDEYLAGLEAEDLDFLTRSSILDSLDGDLCDAVLERQGSGAALRRLARSNMLLTADPREHEFRYHALLREMLAAELRRLGRSEAHALHTRASRWHSAAGDHDRAVAHAIAAGDLARAGELIWGLTADYESSGRGATLRRWLARIGERAVRTSPPLCMTAAAGWATLGDGARVEEWTSAALTALEGGRAARSAELRAVAALLRAAVVGREGVARMSEEATAARESLPADSAWLSMCALIEGVARHLAGDHGAAALLEEGARRGSVITPNIECLCRAQLALLALDEGDPVAAGDSALRAVEIIGRHGLDRDPTQALSIATAALMHARGGRSDLAAGEARVAGELLAACNEMAPWYEAETRIALGRALVLLDDVSGARARLGEAGRHLQRVADAALLREWLRQAWEETDAARSASGRWPLTPAELRLLHRLPTHRSFPEIAAELFVSTNTVKTQARSIYRKLGVSSRAEAVASARAAGLLADVGAPGTPGE